jgi:hypothetical protein
MSMQPGLHGHFFRCSLHADSAISACSERIKTY